MKTKEDIFKKLSAHQAQLDELGIGRIGLFGSFARNTPGPDSDVDLLVEFIHTPGLCQMAELHLQLEKLFARRVDIATREMLAPSLKDHVLAEVVYDEPKS
jgi:uncharacterized protein